MSTTPFRMHFSATLRHGAAWREPLRQAVLLLALAAPVAMAAPAYTYAPLMPLGEPSGMGNGWAINDQGQVAGGSIPSTDVWYQPTVWTSPSMPVKLAGLGGPPAPGVAYGLNDVGQRVGSDVFGNALLWNGTQATLLPTLGGSSAEAMAINNAGQAAGSSFTADTTVGSRATLWQNGVATNLGTLGGYASWASAINASGQVAGGSDTPYGRRATLWTNGTPQSLGSVYGVDSYAQGMNDTGQVVGYDVNAAGGSFAFVWSGNAMSLLAPLEGWGAWSSAFDINNRGQAVGYSFGGGDTRATLWNDGKPTDLNSFLDAASANAGWQLAEAHGINEQGWITGVAVNRSLGQYSGFLLSTVPAVPEPASLALMGAGLAALAWGARRQRLRCGA